MSIIIALLCALSANLDTVCVSASFSMKNIKIPHPSMWLISILSTAGMFVTMLTGETLLQAVPPILLKLTGSLFMLGLGLWFISGHIRNIRKANKKNLISNPENADLDRSGILDLKESAVISIVLTLNNICIGAGAAISNVSTFLTCCFNLVFTYIFLLTGAAFGKSQLSRTCGKYSSLISGILIAVVALASLF